MNYWLVVVSGKSWQSFVDAGASRLAFKDSRWKQVQKIKQGDVVLCCLSGVQRLIGLLEVTAEGQREDGANASASVSLQVSAAVQLTPQTSLPVNVLRGQLSVFKDPKPAAKAATPPLAWMEAFQDTPQKWRKEDGEAVVAALRDAKANPVVRDLDVDALDCRVPLVDTPRGAVAIPDVGATTATAQRSAWARDHEVQAEAQAVLAKLGAGLGLDVWIAAASRDKIVSGTRLADIPRVMEQWTPALDEASSKTVTAFDVVWTRGKTIVAGFVVADAAGLAPRLLRLADLVSLQTELGFPLYLVAASDLRRGVLVEINRPCFRLATPPLTQVCRFIAFESLQRKFEQVAALLGYLKPEFLDEISESCQGDED